MVSGPIFRTLFMVRVRVSVTGGCVVTFNMSTGARIKLQTVEKYSVLSPFPTREITDLSTEPCQEFLTLILKPQIAFLCSYS